MSKILKRLASVTIFINLNPKTVTFFDKECETKTSKEKYQVKRRSFKKEEIV